MQLNVIRYLRTLWGCRKFVLAILLPLGLLPWPLVVGAKEVSCAYVVLLMALFWLFEIVPLAVTALLPVFMFPLMGVLNTDTVCKSYMKETLMIFIGSLMAATAVEHCNLHQRIALRVLLIVGSSPRWLLLGFMVTTTILSMWISNSATTALMVPIVEAVLLQIAPTDPETGQEGARKSVISISESVKSTEEKNKPNIRPSLTPKYQKANSSQVLRKALYLGIGYAANVGGTGTLTGTTPNLILKGILESAYPNYHGLSFASWMLFNLPGAILCMLVAWLFLQLLFIRECNSNKEREESVKKMIQEKYEGLGNISFHEKAVGVLFVIMVLLFFFREPEFINGWAGFRTPSYLKDATTAVFIVVLMFIIPADPSNIRTSPTLLEWKVVQEKVSWGLVLLLGGGFALADAAEASKLSEWLAKSLAQVEVESPLLLQLLVCSIALVLTEVTSNTATSTILLPIIDKIAKFKGMHPLSLMMPVCVSCSYAFMLPIATGPNAIIFDSAKFKTIDMLAPGFVMKILCLGVILFMISTLGIPVFGLNDSLEAENMTTIDFTTPGYY